MGLTNDIIPQNKAFINIKRSYGAGAQRSSLSLSSQYGLRFTDIDQARALSHFDKAQFILRPHLLFPSGWQNLSEWKCKCYIYILFSTASICRWNISFWPHLEPVCFYYGLGIGIFVIGTINHCNRWELTNKNNASLPPFLFSHCNFLWNKYVFLIFLCF